MKFNLELAKDGIGVVHLDKQLKRMLVYKGISRGQVEYPRYAIARRIIHEHRPPRPIVARAVN